MEWSLTFLIITLTITILGFLWGIIKSFKKPHEDKSWVKPIENLKEQIKHDDKECKELFCKDIKHIQEKIIEHGNKIHDLEKDKDVLTNSMDDLKKVINAVSGKCDTILDKVIEYMSRD